MYRTSAIWFLTLFLATFTFGQKSVDKETITVRTNLMVLDADNKHVEELKPSDVKLLENGIERPVDSLTIKKAPLHLSIVIDNTGSLRPQLETVIKLAKILVGNLAEKDEVQIIRFVSRDKITTQPAWTDDRSMALRGIDNLFIEGGQSAVVDALYLAVEDIVKRREAGKADERFAVVLISDVSDRNSQRKEQELISLVEKSNVPVFVLALVRDLINERFNNSDKTKDYVRNLTTRLAFLSGGTSYIFDEKMSNNDHANNLTSLIYELRSQFVISYKTDKKIPKIKADRTLSVTVSDGPNGQKRRTIIKSALALPE